MGRPTIYSEEIASIICERIASGESLRKICKTKGIPARSVIFKWLVKNPVFKDQYALAREESTAALFEEMLEICDDATNDWMEHNAKGTDATIWKLNGEHVQRSKLRVDTRKWALSKLQPKKYGDKFTTEHTGTVNFSSMSEAELDQRISEMEREIERAGED